MPFIRYANGDRAVAGWGTCSCWRGWTLLRKVLGRTLDILHTPDGRLTPGEIFAHLLKHFPAERRFHVVQEEPDRVRLSLVANDLTGSEREELKRIVGTVLGARVRLQLEWVDEISLAGAGKLQVVTIVSRYERPTDAHPDADQSLP